MAIEPASRGRIDKQLSRFRCARCNYGASRRIAPERCPMCGGTVWEFELWRPFSSRDGDGADGPLQGDTGI